MPRRLFVVCSSLAWIALRLVGMAQTAANSGQEGYIPITELPPPQQQMNA
jgi:hypothetical protein